MVLTREEKIEQYLSGTMKEADQKAFEAELADNPGLQEDVKVWQEMSEALSPHREDSFLKNISQVDSHYREIESKRILYKQLGIALLIIILTAIVYFALSSKNSNTQEPIDPTPNSVISNKEVPTKAAIDSQIPPQTPVQEIESVDPVEETPKSESEKLYQAPIAANYDPNPQLEDLIGQELRSKNFTFSISQAGLKSPTKAVYIEGQIETDQADADISVLQLLVFSNKVEDYENYQALFQEKIAPDQDGNFSISFDQKYFPGLFYYLIEDEMSGIIYYVNKFEVVY